MCVLNMVCARRLFEEEKKNKLFLDIFEDMHNPAYGAGSLLAALSKRKDIIQPILAFAVNVCFF